jgi:hypothetical protein
MLTSQNELAFKHVYKFRAFMGMERKSCARLEPDDLHLQATSHSNVFDKYSGGEG